MSSDRESRESVISGKKHTKTNSRTRRRAHVEERRAGAICRKLGAQRRQARGLRREREGVTLTCPLHFWSWDMNSGQPTHEHATPLAEYPVKIEDGVVYVETEGVAPIFAQP